MSEQPTHTGNDLMKDVIADEAENYVRYYQERLRDGNSMAQDRRTAFIAGADYGVKIAMNAMFDVFEKLCREEGELSIYSHQVPAYITTRMREILRDVVSEKQNTKVAG